MFCPARAASTTSPIELPWVGENSCRAGFRQFVGNQLQAIQAALEFAQVLHARDDFLAGVATFLETHATDGLQIEHLRDEQLAGARHDLADPGADLAQQPLIQVAFSSARRTACP